PYDNVQWGAVLKSVNALEMYRQEYHAINYRDVTQFLLFSKRFPRSVHFSIDYASSALSNICSGMPANKALSDMYALNQRFLRTDATKILASGLHEFIDNLQVSLNQADQSIYETFFMR
ncbi:MAG: alpha-E domain-containing protein, partial [Asticcacaulis sp.]